jgi:hypothetical protein
MVREIAAGVIGAVVTASVLWLLGTVGRVTTVFVPKGAIVAFNTGCPSDWAPWAPATDRFLRGTAEPGAIGDHDGRDAVTLTAKNLPRHNHSIHGTDHTQTVGGTTDRSPDEYGRYIDGHSSTGYAGEETPDAISIMPPSVKVLYCIKQ